MAHSELGNREIPTDPGLSVSSGLVELVLGQKAYDASAVDAAADRLLDQNGDIPVPLRRIAGGCAAGPCERSPVAR